MHYRREIDGLRALAVLPVIFFHAGFETFGGGFIGVDVFFVISGYLITSIIVSEKQAGTFTLFKFYERRARRILPALFVVMFACLPFAWLWLLPADLKAFSESLVAVSTFASNILFWLTSGYFQSEAELKPLLHTWSLAVEEQYYLLFPLLLLLTWGLGRRGLLAMLAVLAVISLAAAERGASSSPVTAFYMLPTRGWELLIGAFVALYFSDDTKRHPARPLGEAGGVLGLALIICAIFAFDKQTPFPGLYALVPTIGTALIIFCATQQTTVGRFLGNKLLVGVGLISYSAYLWHQPLFAFAKHTRLDQPGTPLLGTLAAGSVVLAFFSWKYVEVPFRDKRRFSRKQIFTLGAAGSTLFIGLGLIGYLNKGYPSRLPRDAVDALAVFDLHEALRDDGGCNVADDAFAPPGCVKGTAASSPQYVLVGDSHASTLVAEMDAAFRRANLAFRQYTKNGCAFAIGLMRSPTENCEEYQSVYRDELKASGIDTYIVVSRWPHYVFETDFDNGEGGIEAREKELFTVQGVAFTESFAIRREAILRAYQKSIRDLLDDGKRVILVYPIPEQGWNIPRLMAKARFLAGDKTVTRAIRHAIFIERNAEVLRALDGIGEHENLVRVRPEEIFCDTFVKGRCATQMNGVPLYYDDDHLSNAGAHLVVDEIMKHVVDGAMKLPDHAISRVP